MITGTMVTGSVVITRSTLIGMVYSEGRNAGLPKDKDLFVRSRRFSRPPRRWLTAALAACCIEVKASRCALMATRRLCLPTCTPCHCRQRSSLPTIRSTAGIDSSGGHAPSPCPLISNAPFSTVAESYSSSAAHEPAERAERA